MYTGVTSQLWKAAVNMSRFPVLNEAEKENILSNRHSKNTKIGTKRAFDTFSAWLDSKNKSLDLKTCDKDDLNLTLKDFWLEARTKEKNYYKATSLNTIRHGLNRYMQEVRPSDKAVDIIHDPEFKESNIYFQSMIKELKHQGKGDVNHHEPISQEDLETVYKYFERCTEDNVILQHKVYFDLSLYLIRRGRENLRDLRKEHFAVNKDSAGLRYLYAVQSESTKNHQSDYEDNFSKGRMYEILGSDLCPLKSKGFILVNYAVVWIFCSSNLISSNSRKTLSVGTIQCL